MHRLEILVRKSNGSHHSVWEASKNMGCCLRQRNLFTVFLVCSFDLEMLYGGSFSHHDSGVHAQDFPTGWFDPFCEFTGMLMSKNVNNDVSKSSPIIGV